MPFPVASSGKRSAPVGVRLPDSEVGLGLGKAGQQLYESEYFSLLRSNEQREVYMAQPAYMEKQKHIAAEMRAGLIDWLMDLAKRHDFEPETSFLCVFLVDRFLQQIAVCEGQLQALGMAGMMIAVKFEEARKQPSDDSPHPFEVKDLIRSGGFSADKSKLNELLSTEQRHGCFLFLTSLFPNQLLLIFFDA